MPPETFVDRVQSERRELLCVGAYCAQSDCCVHGGSILRSNTECNQVEGVVGQMHSAIGLLKERSQLLAPGQPRTARRLIRLAHIVCLPWPQRGVNGTTVILR